MLAVRGVAQQIAPDVVKADLTIDRPVIRYGDYIKVNARFTLPDKLPAANIPTTIQMKSGTGAWRDIFKSTTNSDGVVTINSLLGNQVQFRAISEGSWERLASTSSEVEVKVNPSLSLSGPSITYLGQTETFTATLTPMATGKTILLERFDPKKNAFVEIARSKVEPVASTGSVVASNSVGTSPGKSLGKSLGNSLGNSLGKGIATLVTPVINAASGSSMAPQFSKLRARLLVKDQLATSPDALVSTTLWITTLKP
jgi:hypothetical protein